MKTHLALALTVFLANWSLAQTSPPPTAIQLDGKVTVHIQSATTLVPTTVALEIYHVFPKGDYSAAEDSLLLGKQEVWLECPARTVGRASLSIGDSELTILSIPGDTVYLDVQASGNTEKPVFAFSGKSQPLQEYYQAKETRLPELQQKIWMQGMNSPDLAAFQHAAEKAKQEEQIFLKQYQNQHPLPDWFVAFESATTDYYYDWTKLYVAMYYVDFKKAQSDAPKGYYAFLDNADIKNETALYNYEYLRFLREYLGLYMRRAQLNPAQHLSHAKERFEQPTGDFFEIWELSESADNPEATNSWSKKTFPEEYQYLVDYVQTQSQKSLHLLTSGEKAPNFALVDGNDSLVTLSQFKGQVVYLSFWFTSCGPCVKEFPYENKLVEQFSDRPFKVISICVGTPGAPDEVQVDKWKETSRRFGLKTLDLYANKSWAETLQKKYSVNSFPHYVLIGADGSIIENFAPRPSNGVADKIEKALAEIR